MAIQTVNPATGERVREFAALSRARHRDEAGARTRGPRRLAARTGRRARAQSCAARRDARAAEGGVRAADDARDGQDRSRRAIEEAGEMRDRLPLLRRSRRAISRRRAGRRRSGESELRRVPADRRRARGDAVEFSVLAGHPFRGAGALRRQRRAAQARVERSAVRAGARGALSSRRARRRASSRRCSIGSDAVAAHARRRSRSRR